MSQFSRRFSCAATVKAIVPTETEQRILLDLLRRVSEVVLGMLQGRME